LQRQGGNRVTPKIRERIVKPLMKPYAVIASLRLSRLHIEKMFGKYRNAGAWRAVQCSVLDWQGYSLQHGKTSLCVGMCVHIYVHRCMRPAKSPVLYSSNTIHRPANQTVFTNLASRDVFSEGLIEQSFAGAAVRMAIRAHASTVSQVQALHIAYLNFAGIFWIQDKLVNIRTGSAYIHGDHRWASIG